MSQAPILAFNQDSTVALARVDGFAGGRPTVIHKSAYGFDSMGSPGVIHGGRSL